MKVAVLSLLTFAVCIGLMSSLLSESDLDRQVKAFLDSRKEEWRDMNVPERDGKLLHDLIVENGYTKALEIGTSTGRSSIWMAWALSKTGGTLITIDLDERRHKQALANFREAGVSDLIDARLADAHQLVRELEGPFDFVFSDADKGWYTNYLKDILPKLEVGGCFTAHNTSMRNSAMREFLDYLNNQPSLETTFDDSSGAGLSISYKRSD
jgi:predicted O-methyltransferase YrrM